MELIIKYRTEIMGFSILWIIFYHTGIDAHGAIYPIFFFKRIGYCGVDLFLFLSGMGLFYSISRNSDVMQFTRSDSYVYFLYIGWR